MLSLFDWMGMRATTAVTLMCNILTCNLNFTYKSMRNIFQLKGVIQFGILVWVFVVENNDSKWSQLQNIFVSICLDSYWDADDVLKSVFFQIYVA